MVEWLEGDRIGVKAQLRYERMSAFKVRPVLDLVRGKPVREAQDILARTPRAAAGVVAKVVASAAANAENNELLDQEELYIDTCFADEANTLKRWRPRARGRATRIRKRMCHITVVVARLPEDKLAELRSRSVATPSGNRARRVLTSRRSRKSDSNVDELTTAEELVDEGLVAQEVGAQEVDVQEVGAQEAKLHETESQGDKGLEIKEAEAQETDAGENTVETSQQTNSATEGEDNDGSNDNVASRGDDSDDAGRMSDHVDGQEQ